MNINNISLPKWPQMIVTGKSVTIEQAKDIIFRTDSFLISTSKYEGGNNKQFNQSYREVSGLNKLDGKWDILQKLKEELGCVETTYVTNDWASCCFIFGPHGWCHPNGKIKYIDNVGKWPSPEELIEDWTKLATAFPYLDLNVTLMSGESSEDDIQPVFNIRVVNGTVTIEEPNLSVHENTCLKRDFSQFSLDRKEQGLPLDWILEFAAKVNNTITRLLT